MDKQNKFFDIILSIIILTVFIAQILLIFLKAFGILTCSWFIAFLPLIISFGLIFLFILFATFCAVIASGRFDD